MLLDGLRILKEDAMKISYRSVGFCSLILLFTCSQQVLAQPAPNCLHIQEEGKRVIWENVCEEEISIAYCSPTKPIFGRKCGDGGKTNAFYTHLTNMKGKSKDNHPLADKDYRVAPCYGYINGWDLKGKFWSTADGLYGCADPAEANAGVVISTSPGATIEEACKNAQAMVLPPNMPSGCTCQQRGKVQMCYVMSLKESTTDSMIGIAKRKIIEMARCKPEEKECTAPRMASMGVRDGASDRQ
jgi:hypothetical protein